MFLHKFGRIFILLVLYSLILTSALYLAFQLRFDFDAAPYFHRFYLGLALSLGLGLPLLAWFGQFRSLLSFFGLPDIQKIFMATALANLILLVFWYGGLAGVTPPRAVIILNFILGSAGLIILRGAFRLARERWLHGTTPKLSPKKVAIYGAGSAGAALLGELLARPQLRIKVAAIFDDDPKKVGNQLHGVPVMGDLVRLRKSAHRLGIQEVILATPEGRSDRLRAIVAQCRRLNLPVRTIPTIHHMVNGRLHLDRIKPVEFEDMLARESVEMEVPATASWIAGRRVMVTGAGGTIGAELARQIWACHPKCLILIERSEPALFEIEQELKEEGAGSEVISVVSDVGDDHHLEATLNRQKPDLIFHAAAHKHVPMMESQVGEALANNTLKTLDLAEAAARHEVKDFVMISTDKAINPTNVMGASKRLAELGLQLLQKKNPRMKIISVRFGNVLGSSGSVIPTFRRQIAAGGPVTVTHPEVTRYFMSVAEAVGLVLSAGRLGKEGEIFVLDMGEPVKIEAMARQLIELSGFEPGREIEIRYTGLRPGEKLYEELSHHEELTERTEHPKIWKLKPQKLLGIDFEALKRSVREIILEAAKDHGVKAKQKIRDLIPEYTPWLG